MPLVKTDSPIVKIAIIDDHQMFLDGISLVIGNSARNCQVFPFQKPLMMLEALERGDDFDVIICDLIMGNMNGLAFIRALRSQSSIPVLMLSGIGSSPPTEEMRRLGAQGFIHKSADNETLSAAVDSVLGGGEYFDDMAMEASGSSDQFGSVEQFEEIDEVRGSELTTRQIEVLQLMAQGATNKEISETLNISPNTVKSHLKMIFDLLKVNKRTACVRVAQAHGLV